MEDPAHSTAEEVAKLKRELKQQQAAYEQEKVDLEKQVESERLTSLAYNEQMQQRTSELEAMKGKMVKLTRQLDDEVTRRDQMQAETSSLERKVQDLSRGQAATPAPAQPQGRSGRMKIPTEDEQAAKEKGAQVSTKLMRVVDQWMRQRDLQQALLRGASINDTAFSTLVQALSDCQSLQTLDLSQNLLTMDSCSDLCQLITTSPNLSFISLADNLMSLRSIGYFMTAVMERQNTKKLMPLDLLDLQGNEGLVAAASAPVPEHLLKQVTLAMQNTPGRLPIQGNELIAQVMRALWRFLHDTQHPQVRDTSPDEVSFYVMDKVTIRKMENALMKILLLSAEGAEAESSSVRPVTANLAFVPVLDAPKEERPSKSWDAPPQAAASGGGAGYGHAPSGGGYGGGSGYASAKGPAQAPSRSVGGGMSDAQRSASQPKVGRPQESTQRPAKVQVADPFADLKTAFEPPKEKLKTFNLKQIVTRNGTVLMNMLERLLETTEIDARDVETDQTLLEYACHTGNMGLAKLCYRRGANLSAKTGSGDTAFNIVTRNRRYDLMEFLHTYGVKVNTACAKGTTALHAAASNDDVDGVCRLLEWGADVNIKDAKKRTPIHVAAAGGNIKTTMLLLEVGADMNAKDEREFTAVAHAEANNHFQLMDRLVALGGRGHGMNQKSAELARSKSAKMIGELVIGAGVLKSSSLGRIGKVAVENMPGPIMPSLGEDMKGKK